MLITGWPFAVSLLAILLAHEFGHYFVGRAGGAAVTLPYFIPLPAPLSPISTLGVFIQMKSIPRNKRALFDLAIAGPLAGLVVAIPVLLYGLSQSSLGRIAAVQGAFEEGNSVLYLLAKFVIFGKMLPAPVNLSGLPLLYHWITYFFAGQPSPVGSMDVMLGQVAWAGWVGLLVTFLNLVPAGQLDGGHIIYAVLGKRANRILPIILIVMVLLGFLWLGWWLWAVLLFLMGRSHAEPLDQITQLDPSRKALAVLNSGHLPAGSDAHSIHLISAMRLTRLLALSLLAALFFPPARRVPQRPPPPRTNWPLPILPARFPPSLSHPRSPHFRPLL